MLTEKRIKQLEKIETLAKVLCNTYYSTEGEDLKNVIDMLYREIVKNAI